MWRGVVGVILGSLLWGTSVQARTLPAAAIVGVEAVSAEDSPAYPATNAIDRDPSTFWHTAYTPVQVPTSCAVAPYCWIIVKLNQNYTLNKLVYYPRFESDQPSGRVGTYHIYVTTDDPCALSSTWTDVATGVWANDQSTKKATWAATPARCVKLESRLSASNSTSYMHAAEIYLFDTTTASDTPPAGAISDFTARCSAAGVTACYGFDEAIAGASANHVKDWQGTDWGVNLGTSGASGNKPTWDTTLKTSGAGSLRFTVPPPPHDGESASGQFFIDPGNNTSIGGPGNDFGPNETWYFQFRHRVSSEAMYNSWNAAYKLFAFYRSPVPCSSNQPGLVLETYEVTELLTGYSRCGADHWTTDSDLATWKNPTPFWHQQGDMNDCQYTTWRKCYFQRPDEWTTYYCKFTSATFGSTGHGVECWFAREGETAWTKFINVTQGYQIDSLSGQGFNSAFFSVYMTGLAGTTGDPGVTSIVNIDEVIFSTQPIAIPAVTTSSSLPGQSGGGKRSGGARR